MLVLDKFDALMLLRLRQMGARTATRALAGHRVFTLELDGEGPGPAVVLVHGLGSSMTGFFRLYAGLRRSWKKIYALDLPGHGRSALAPGQDPLDVRGHAAVVGAFLDEVVQEPAALIGNSMGGAISLQMALERPQTPALALLSPAGAPLGEEGLASLRTGFRPRSRAEALQLLRRMMHRAPMSAWLIGSDFVQLFNRPAVHHVLEHTAADERIAPELLATLRMPTLLVWGASERLLPPGGVDYFRAHLPSHARIEVFERCAHLPMMEQPRRTLDLLDALAQEAVRRQAGPLPLTG